MLGLVLGACSSLFTEPDVPIKERYAVSADASPECIAAAKRASRWCVSEITVGTDVQWAAECNGAKWDYARYCR